MLLKPRQTNQLSKPRTALPLALVSGVFSAFCLVLADLVHRDNFDYVPLGRHLFGALGMYTGVGVLFGVLLLGLVSLESRLIARRATPRARWARPFFYGIVGALASLSTAISVFSGERVQKTLLVYVGPIVFSGALGLAALIGSAFVLRILAAPPRAAVSGALGFLALGALIARVDLTQYVALYSRIHTLLEVIAALCFGAAMVIAARLARQSRPSLDVTLAALSLLFGAWFVATLCVPALRRSFDEALRHVWLDEVYAGRMLRRLQIAETFFRDPLGFPGVQMARVRRLQDRFDLRDLSLAARWREPLVEDADSAAQIAALRAGAPRFNVIVYYVDTLRADVARDARVMPGLARFRESSLDFDHAYAVGSDTLRSLPALTGGNYDVLQTPPNDLLRVAPRAGYETAIAIAKSAYEFLEKQRPEFHFATRFVVPDYPAELQVWGYGAQQPTAAHLVDHAIEFLDRPRDKPFLLWLFNFDQHNWRQLEDQYVDEQARQFGVKEETGSAPLRYRSVARSIDAQFERLLSALAVRKLTERTIVLFVSDHGEGLGREGFWAHSVFLWEPLVRVPLVLRVPGIAGRRLSDRVSLVDVAPTLGRYLEPGLDGQGFHGQDLLGYLLPAPPRRRHPLLMVSASKDMLVRIGMIDPYEPFKLVVSFESALPELYDLRAREPDDRDLAAQETRRVRQGLNLLAHSPLFPRSAEDFDVRDTKEQKAQTR
ncbi:MAG TPA: sulfatase-like hydrolase/transferase [Polyangiaceae bacterium]|nr:sulfatase-like hydrolase/transferase [Polyangiaceae bacterium]